MNPILLAQLLQAIITVAPQAIGLVIKLKQDIDAGRTATTVTTEDLQELDRLCQLNSAAIYARLGITPPPPKAA